MMAAFSFRRRPKEGVMTHAAARIAPTVSVRAWDGEEKGGGGSG